MPSLSSAPPLAAPHPAAPHLATPHLAAPHLAAPQSSQSFELNIPDEYMFCWRAQDTSFRELISSALPEQDAPRALKRRLSWDPLEYPPAGRNLSRPGSLLCAEATKGDDGSELGELPVSVVNKQTLYEPHGKYDFMVGKLITEPSDLAVIDVGSSCAAYIRRAGVVSTGSFLGADSEDKLKLTYVCKTWRKVNMSHWYGFFTELAVYKGSQYLRPLQGSVVPAVIGVHDSDTSVNVAMEPPHPVFWFEASASMPAVLKAKVVAAYEQIHKQGVLHNSVALRHMLIGADTRVTIIDFQNSRASEENEDVGLAFASNQMFKKEMRHVKFVLDFEYARETEEGKIEREVRRKAHNKDIERQRLARKAAGLPTSDLKKWNAHPNDRAEPPLHPEVLERWKEDCRPRQPRRWVMPGVDAAQLAGSVVDFIGQLKAMWKGNREWSVEVASPEPDRPSPPPDPLDQKSHARTPRVPADPQVFLDDFARNADRHRSFSAALPRFAEIFAEEADIKASRVRDCERASVEVLCSAPSLEAQTRLAPEPVHFTTLPEGTAAIEEADQTSAETKEDTLTSAPGLREDDNDSVADRGGRSSSADADPASTSPAKRKADDEDATDDAITSLPQARGSPTKRRKIAKFEGPAEAPDEVKSAAIHGEAAMD